MIKSILFFYIYFIIGVLVSAIDIDILIINLKNRPDKRKLCDFQMKVLGIPYYKYIEGFNGKDFMSNESAILTKESGLSDIKIDRNLIARGNEAHFGCLVSHMKAFKNIITRNQTQPVLILEDDFLADGLAFRDLPRFVAQLPADWDVFYPGHCAPKNTCGTYLESEQRICKPKGIVSCTQSFMVNGAKAAQKLYNAVNKQHFLLADQYGHLIDINRYVLFPSIFTQVKRYLSVESDIKSEGGAWTPLVNGTIANLLKSHLDK